MAQGSRQVQTQAQQQIQTLSPQQILVVKLLELPTVELEERIHSEILDNPALEEGKEMPENEDDNTEYVENEDGNTDSNEDFSLGDYSNEDDIPDYKLQEHNRSKEGVAEEIPFSDAVSFYEILKDQLQMQELTPEQRDIAEYLIGSLDDDGLLRKNMESIMDELAIYRGIYTTEEELNKILEIIQDFDPAGIGARSLQECLLLQIQRKADSPLKQIELDIIGKCCDEFTRKNKERIIQKLGITEEQYNEAVSDLTKLNPRPGSSLGEAMGKNMQQIIPDFIVETYEDDTITLSLNNRNVPELRLSRQFTELLDEHTRNKRQSEQSLKGRTDVPKTKSRCRTRFYQRRKTATTYVAHHHASHYRYSAPLLFGRRRIPAKAHDPKRCSRTLGIGYFHHITGKQQQICTNKLWYLFVEILFQRRLHYRRR